MNMVAQGVLIGVPATILIDGWALILKHAFGLPTTNWNMVGRWVGHLHHGRFKHHDIASSAPVARESMLGWTTHYVVGGLYGIGYVWLVIEVLNQQPGPASAILYSVILLTAPWFILQPGLGLGILGRRAPRPWLMRMVNVSVHIVFGIGLYLGCYLLERWTP